jgi:hypothetical protein
MSSRRSRRPPSCSASRTSSRRSRKSSRRSRKSSRWSRTFSRRSRTSSRRSRRSSRRSRVSRRCPLGWSARAGDVWTLCARATGAAPAIRAAAIAAIPRFRIRSPKASIRAPSWRALLVRRSRCRGVKVSFRTEAEGRAGEASHSSGRGPLGRDDHGSSHRGHRGHGGQQAARTWWSFLRDPCDVCGPIDRPLRPSKRMPRSGRVRFLICPLRGHPAPCGAALGMTAAVSPVSRTATRYPLPATRYPLPATRYPLPATRYPLPASR